MSSPGVNNNAPQVRIQIQAQQQAAHQQQQLSSNQTQNQQLANHQHGMKNAMPAQSQNVSHAGTYYSNAGTNGKADLSANVQNAANAATAYDLLRRMIRGEAVSPAQEL
ncbi:MAG: hypothetical protein KTR14_11670, partial [Vampirovibrio sp.]|nr:hypothetical protein [Vampirovibrio sp.]